MSGGAIFQETLRRVVALDLPPVAAADVVSALEAARHPGLLQLVYEAGFEAGLERAALLGRAAGVFANFAAGNLADDLVDGDCDYLDPPLTHGPSVQFFLQHLCTSALVDAGVSPRAIGRFARWFCLAVGGQQLEVRATAWDAALYRRVGEALAAGQMRAYLDVLWDGTPLEDKAETVGGPVGYLGHLAEDLRSKDRRFFGMPASDQRLVVDEASFLCDALAREPLRTARFAVDAARAALAGVPT